MKGLSPAPSSPQRRQEWGRAWSGGAAGAEPGAEPGPLPAPISFSSLSLLGLGGFNQSRPSLASSGPVAKGTRPGLCEGLWAHVHVCAVPGTRVYTEGLNTLIPVYSRYGDLARSVHTVLIEAQSCPCDDRPCLWALHMDPSAPWLRTRPRTSIPCTPVSAREPPLATRASPALPPSVGNTRPLQRPPRSMTGLLCTGQGCRVAGGVGVR